MIKIVRSIIIFIDHVANLSIVRQIKLSFDSIDKLNLRLIKAFIYLSQFKLNIKYRLNKQHVISDVLFRLSVKKFAKNIIISSRILNLNTFYFNILDFEDCDVYTYQSTFVIMSLEFKKAVKNEYQKKIIWTNIIDMLKKLNKQN